jgi:hypothetical protein
MLPLSFYELNIKFEKLQFNKSRWQVGTKLQVNIVFILISTLNVKYILILL